MKEAVIQITKPIGSFEDENENQIHGISYVDVLAAVTALPADTDTLIVEMAGLGGVAEVADEIHALLLSLKPRMKIVMEQLSHLGSAHTRIWTAGDVRNVKKGKKFIIHNPWRRTEGDAQAHADAAVQIKKREDQYIAMYSESTGLPIDTVQTLMKNDTGMTAEQAVALKFATGFSQYTPKAAIQTIAYIMETPKKKSSLGQRLEAIFAQLKDALSDKDLSLVMLNLKDGGAIAVNATDPTQIDGAEAWQVGTDGNATQVKAPPGDHALADGRVVTVGEDGKVSKVTATAPQAKTEIAPQVAALVTEMKKLVNGKKEGTIKVEDFNKVLALAEETIKAKKEAPKKDDGDNDDPELGDDMAGFLEELEGLLGKRKEKSNEERIMAMVDDKIKALKGEIKTKHQPRRKSVSTDPDRKSPAQSYLES